MHPARRHARSALFAAPLLLIALSAAACSDPQTTIEPKSDYAQSVQNVYVIVFWLAAAVFVAIMAATLIFSLAFRERPGREARQFHGNTRLEILWTLIPVALAIAIAVPTFISIHETTRDRPDADDNVVEVEVVGHQWWFEFNYTGLGIVTANEIHLPVDRPALFTLKSEDVIHSFWVPQLAGKVDIVPGHANELWFTPNEARAEPFLGQCAEFCGLSHANMRFRVYVDTEADFEAWVARQLSDAVEPATDEAAAGQQLFLSASDPETGLSCITCHTIAGTIAPGTIGPNLTHIGGRSTIAAGIMPNTQEDLIRWISNPDREKPGVSPDQGALFMPAWEDVLTQDEISSIAIYLLSLE